MYTAKWRQFIKETYGALPQVAYFETPVVVDNIRAEIVKG